MPRRRTSRAKAAKKVFRSIRKRDGRIVFFRRERITNAIYKASVAVGQPDWKLAEELAEEAVKRLRRKISFAKVPTVEQVQDEVERILIEKGQAKIAKAYILYRQHRAEIRREKQRVLNKEEIDEVDKKFDLNALRVLASRYLRKNERRAVIESPKELFSRVALHSVLPSIFYDPKVCQRKGGAKEHRFEEFDSLKNEGKFGIGKFKFNQFHLEALKRLYDFFNSKQKMKVSWSRLLAFLKEKKFDSYEAEIQSYYDIMVNRRFLPNTPALANFGSYLGMGSACFVLDVEDSIDGPNSIMETLKNAAVIFKAGGGVGYNFSKLRPEGDFVKSTGGVASGPISFMSMFDNMTEVVKQGGIRRGANMGILNSSHPDVEKFISAKEGNKALRNFNISVLIMSDFWDSYRKNEPYPLVNPRNGEIVRYVNPKQLFDKIVYQAWESAEPGVIFFDKVNEYNPFFKELGPIVSTNPCGELLLYPFESCNLGSINVWSFVKDNHNGKVNVDWEKMSEVVRVATRFLDNVVDVNKYPMKEIQEMTMSTRKIGLGVMGVGDLLYELGIPYNSKQGLAFLEQLMEFINYHSKIVSIELAKERGRMPFFDKSFYKEGKLPFSGFKDKNSWHFDWDKISKDIQNYGIRNSYTTAVAPTGSISMIAGCSSGMEPVYSLVFEKNVSVGSFYYVDPVFESRMQKEGLMDADLLRDVVALSGSVQNLSYIPAKLKKNFVTALDIAPRDHIRSLAAVQKWTDSSVSKTNNFPADATVDYMKDSYLLAYELGCKDVTVYRDTSIKNQVLVSGDKKKREEKQKKDGEAEKLIPMKDEKAKGLAVYQAKASGNGETLNMSPAADFAAANLNGNGKCPSCGTELVKKEGCRTCPGCGWGLCV